jgi:hypothetical protein
MRPPGAVVTVAVYRTSRRGYLEGCVNKLTDPDPSVGYTGGMRTQVSDEAWERLAKSLDVEAAALKAVATVEAAGAGFLPGEPPRPKILFEAHAFHRLTAGRFAKQAPNLSNPTWNRKLYAGSVAGEWQRLEAACKLDRPAALQSASWGLFQIMGFNYAYCGCWTSKPSSRSSTPAPRSSSRASRVSSRGRHACRRCATNSG